jgi:catechol 2,3-dioxygenase-like lactoylglutathione lyase family enzyme
MTRVRDSAVAQAFYCGVLGCELARRREDLGLMHLRPGASMIDLVTRDGPLGRRGGEGPGAQAGNVDHVPAGGLFDAAAIAAHLAAHGVWASEASVNYGAEGDGLPRNVGWTTRSLSTKRPLRQDHVAQREGVRSFKTPWRTAGRRAAAEAGTPPYPGGPFAAVVDESASSTLRRVDNAKLVHQDTSGIRTATLWN